MLRRCFLAIFVFLTALPFLPNHALTTERLRRLTFTNEQSLNVNPILSADGRFVVFESSTDLAEVSGTPGLHTFRVDVGTENLSFEQIAATRAFSASLSADGQKIAFASTEDLVGQNSDRNSEIYLFANSELRQLTNTRPNNETSRLIEGNFEPSISSDGRWIAFSSNRNVDATSPLAILLIDTTQNTSTQLTTTGYATTPKISGDGKRIFFVQQELADLEGFTDLLVYDVSDRSRRTLVQNIDGFSFTNTAATSFDGNRVVYSARTAPNETQVFLFDLRENQPRQLTQLGSRSTDVQLNATISGDGKRIAFATRRKTKSASDGSVELYLLDLPTGSTEQITNAPSSATAEVVSSLNHDGSLVAFNFPRLLSAPVADPELGNNSELYLARLDPRPKFGEATVTNAASHNHAELRIAPDSIAAISGNQLSLVSEQARMVGGDLPLSIKGTSVTVNGHPAHLFYVSPDEVIFLVPSELIEGPAEVVVVNPEGFPSKATTTITRAAPGIFTDENHAVILNADTLTAAPFDPTDGIQRLSLFATGVRNATEMNASIGGEPIAIESVTSSSLPGLDEIHLLLPATLRGAGTVSVSVKANNFDSDLVSTVIGGSSLRDIMINEILTDPPDGLPGDANHDGVRDSSADEFIELINTTSRDIDLTGFQLQTRTSATTNDSLRHRFAPGTILQAGTAIVIFGGGVLRSDNQVFGGAQIVRASTGSLSLTNSGGVVTLREPSGTVISFVNYGAGAGLPGDANQSLTRAPDVAGGFQLHLLTPGDRAFSPGTRIDGQPFLISPALSLIAITPSSGELVKGDHLQFSARAFDIENKEVNGVIFNWISSNKGVVTIDPDGLANAVAGGNAEIAAIGRGVRSAPAVVTVAIPTPSPTPTPTSSPTPTPTPPPSPSPTPIPTPSPSPGPAGILISEFRTRGPSGASDEFIEIYNNSDTEVDVGGLKLRGSSSSGTITNKLTITANTAIPAHGHFLATNSSGYSGSVAGDQTFTSGIANDGGIALTMPDDTIIDQVGLSAGSAFREGTHLSPLPSDANQSYERKPGGASGSSTDTQNNFGDFQFLVPSDPQNRLSNPTPGTRPSPSPTPGSSPSPTPSPTITPSPTPAQRVVISQVFGGGGNSGAPFRNDFIEIFNAGSAEVNLDGWSVQYASATASTWSVTNLTSIALRPGQYYLIQETSGGSNGIALPTPDATGSISLAASSGKVALVRTVTPLSGTCPTDGNIIDLVGYGNTASCFEGAAAPVPGNSTSIARVNDGCTDSERNANDFIVMAPTPRNTSSAVHPCASTIGNSSIDLNLLWLLLGVVAAVTLK